MYICIYMPTQYLYIGVYWDQVSRLLLLINLINDLSKALTRHASTSVKGNKK